MPPQMTSLELKTRETAQGAYMPSLLLTFISRAFLSPISLIIDQPQPSSAPTRWSVLLKRWLLLLLLCDALPRIIRTQATEEIVKLQRQVNIAA